MIVRFERRPIASVFGGITDFERSIDSLFDTFMGTPYTGQVGQFPMMDVADYDDRLVITAEMPGVKKDDVKISLQNGTLMISGTRNPAQFPEDATWLRNEIRTGSFSRSLVLPNDVQMDKIDAEMTNGILQITLPKAEEARPREIQVH